MITGFDEEFRTLRLQMGNAIYHELGSERDYFLNFDIFLDVRVIKISLVNDRPNLGVILPNFIYAHFKLFLNTISYIQPILKIIIPSSIISN